MIHIMITITDDCSGTSASPHLSRESLESVESDESEMSVAGVMNRRLGLLLGYHESLSPGQVSAGDTGGLSANITGYEIVCAGDKHKYTVRENLILSCINTDDECSCCDACRIHIELQFIVCSLYRSYELINKSVTKLSNYVT